MAERVGDLPASLDVGAVGKAMLEAARAAHIGVTVTLVEPTGARIVYMSEVAADICGWPLEEVLAGDPLASVAPEDLARVRERLGKRTDGDRGESSYEITLIRKDGRRVPIEMTASHAILDGKPAVFAFIVDLSARKSAEEARLRTEARFRELIDKAPEPIGIVRGGRFVYANRAYVSVLGYPTAEALYAVPVTSLVHPEETALLLAHERLIINENGKPPPHTFRVQKHAGSFVQLEVSTVPFDYEGKPSMLTMARDVTARRTLEAQLMQADRLAALGTMAAGVAHEINNPLAYVTLNLDWIARKLPDAVRSGSGVEGLAELLQEARSGVERVAMIVRELRSFSRADGETRRHVDLRGVVQSASRIAAHEIRHRARVSTSFEPVRPVWANEARLEQVVLNLLLNAAQAMSETRTENNEIRVSVRSDGDSRAILEVADNGQGIAPDVLPHIFDPFFTTKANGVGTGLGLSICHGIVAALGGQVTVHSEPGQGTTFRVLLPTSDAADAPTPPRGSDAPPPPGARRARVLVVDDEMPIANTLRELLSLEHDVVAVTSGREALDIVHREGDFDVILCDLMMPEMSGIDLYERLRHARPGLERRVVFMTGGAFTTRAAAFLASVDNRRIEKPFSLKVVERIAQEMAGSAAQQPRPRPEVLVNIDLGELPDEAEALYEAAHVANIACGGHAGDEVTMGRAVERCLAHGVRIGAHPSYPDREGFGRRALAIGPDALRASVADQCARLARIVGAAGRAVDFVKAHGALYHAAQMDNAIADALLGGARLSLGPRITVIGPAGGALAGATSRSRMSYAREAFADRGARPDGTLVARGEPGALVVDPAAAAARARELSTLGNVETICVHGDTPGAVAIARAVRAALDEARGA
jgi:PAS domain S-box-containing protein